MIHLTSTRRNLLLRWNKKTSSKSRLLRFTSAFYKNLPVINQSFSAFATMKPSSVLLANEQKSTKAPELLNSFTNININNDSDDINHTKASSSIPSSTKLEPDTTDFDFQTIFNETSPNQNGDILSMYRLYENLLHDKKKLISFVKHYCSPASINNLNPNVSMKIVALSEYFIVFLMYDTYILQNNQIKKYRNLKLHNESVFASVKSVYDIYISAMEGNPPSWHFYRALFSTFLKPTRIDIFKKNLKSNTSNQSNSESNPFDAEVITITHYKERMLQGLALYIHIIDIFVSRNKNIGLPAFSVEESEHTLTNKRTSVNKNHHLSNQNHENQSHANVQNSILLIDEMIKFYWRQAVYNLDLNQCQYLFFFNCFKILKLPFLIDEVMDYISLTPPTTTTSTTIMGSGVDDPFEKFDIESYSSILATWIRLHFRYKNHKRVLEIYANCIKKNHKLPMSSHYYVFRSAAGLNKTEEAIKVYEHVQQHFESIVGQTQSYADFRQFLKMYKELTRRSLALYFIHFDLEKIFKLFGELDEHLMNNTSTFYSLLRSIAAKLRQESLNAASFNLYYIKAMDIIDLWSKRHEMDYPACRKYKLDESLANQIMNIYNLGYFRNYKPPYTFLKSPTNFPLTQKELFTMKMAQLVHKMRINHISFTPRHLHSLLPLMGLEVDTHNISSSSSSFSSGSHVKRKIEIPFIDDLKIFLKSLNMTLNSQTCYFILHAWITSNEYKKVYALWNFIKSTQKKPFPTATADITTKTTPNSMETVNNHDRIEINTMIINAMIRFYNAQKQYEKGYVDLSTVILYSTPPIKLDDFTRFGLAKLVYASQKGIDRTLDPFVEKLILLKNDIDKKDDKQK